MIHLQSRLWLIQDLRLTAIPAKPAFPSPNRNDLPSDRDRKYTHQTRYGQFLPAQGIASRLGTATLHGAMMRILHLLDHDADFQTRRMAAMVAHGLKTDFIPVAQTVGGYPHQLLAQARQIKLGQWNLVHTWGTRALMAAALAGVPTIVHTPSPKSRACIPNWLRRINRRCAVHLIEGIATPLSFAIGQCDQTARQRYGISPEDIVILAPGESTRASGHRLALWTLAILHEVDQRWKLLSWGRGAMTDDLRRMARRLGRPELLHLAPDLEFESLLPLSDAALVTPRPQAATLPLALCMAGGLPIVATAAAPFLSPRRALIAADGLPRSLAQKLLELHADPALQQSLAHAAQADAQQNFSPEKFLARHRAVYAQAFPSQSSVPSPQSSPLTRPDS
jgi:glycosyltransferase involved in cell wall biosynthesis